MKTVFACILFFFTSVWANCQETEFLNGYIVTFSKDTLFGKVKDRKLGWSHELINKIHIKFDNGRVKKIKKKNITTYKRGNEVFVRSRITEQLPILNIKEDADYFLVTLVSGNVELYKHYFNDQDSGIIDYVFLIRSKNSTIYKRLPPLGFKKILRRHFGQSSGIVAKLESKKYRYADIPTLVKELNR